MRWLRGPLIAIDQRGGGMKQERDEREGQKRYEPPRLVVINLRPEEAVLGHCKTFTGGPGPNSSSCFVVGPCQSIGS
jgi:hypothetical protein